MMLRRILLLLALAAPGLAWGQSVYPAERIARLSYVEGEATFQAAGERTTGTLPDRPLIPGDRLITERDGRAELALGTATLRLDEQSELAILDLDAETTRVELVSGTASVYLNELLEGETFEIATPNSAITLDAPGEYRADVFDEDATALTVRQGAASVDAAGGPVRVAAGQRVLLDGRDAVARLETPRPVDAFDDWVLEREVRLAEAEPPRYTPFEDGEYDYDYEELDRYGEWYDEPSYGRVWMPSYGYSSWSPYYGGYWQRTGFSYSWYDPAPWGYFTYYSGRWTYLHDRHRWCWVPAPRPRPRPSAPDIARRERLAAVPRGNLPTRMTPVTTPRTPERRTVAMTPSAPDAPRRVEAERRPVRTRVDAGNDRAPERERTAARTVATPSRSQGDGPKAKPSRPEQARSDSKPDTARSRREIDTPRPP